MKIWMKLFLTVLVCVTVNTYTEANALFSQNENVSLDKISSVEKQITQKFEKKRARAHRLLDEGIYLYEQGEYKKAAEKFLQIKNLVNTPMINIYIAKSYAHLYNPEKTFEYFDYAITLYETGNFGTGQKNISSIHKYKGSFYLERKEYEKALNEYRLSLKHASDEDKKAQLIDIIIHIQRVKENLPTQNPE